MKRYLRYALMAFGMLLCTGVQAQDTLFVRQRQVPFLIERQDNELMLMRLNATTSKELDHITLQFDASTPLDQIQSVKLYYGGTEARQDYGAHPYAPCDYLTSFTPNKTLAALPSYSVKLDEQQPAETRIALSAHQRLFPGYNYFWVSIQMKPTADFTTKVSAKVLNAIADRANIVVDETPKASVLHHRMALGVRHAGDDGAAAYRIPGLVTTKEGTLLGVYDVRYNNSVDLQEHIEIGVSRSIDKGKTWQPMHIALSMAHEGGLPTSQNGVGDPAILVDQQTGTIWIVALWAHGMGNKRAWFSSCQGISPEETGQLVMVKSDDDGQTWSKPINITAQVKHPDWYLLLQGPGRGITMKDGTIVFAMQFIDKNRLPHSGILYSKDHGKTWKVSEPARDNTTEAQVVELTPRVLMLNMRDNRGGSRAVYTTKDMGKTWQEHPSNRSALIEPVCMGSLLKVEAKDNCLKKDILLFSNPNTIKDRKNITIKLSLDGGLTWRESNQVLLDEGTSWGYSCLTMIDRETVGILYESSVAHMTFQTVKLSELMTTK